MANEKVPWTTPGEPSCCCEDNCFTDLVNSPKPVFAENTWANLSAENYSALLAGGTYKLFLEMDVVANVEVFGGPTASVVNTIERHVCSVSDQLMTQDASVSAALPCYARLQKGVTITREYTDIDGAESQTQLNTTVELVRMLGTDGSQKKLSLASVEPASSPNSIRSVLTTSTMIFNMPESVSFRTGNMTGTVPYTCQGSAEFAPHLSGVSCEVSLQIDNLVYVAAGAVAHPCFDQVFHFNQIMNGAGIPCGTVVASGICFGSVTGTFDMNVVFTPSAP